VRNHLLDNSKVAFLILVVFGHLLEVARGTSASSQALYLFLYGVHIPGLVFLSGVFAHREISAAALSSSVRLLLIPFIVFEVVYEGFHLLTYGTVSHYASGCEPHWLLWYLLSLFMWRLILPVVLLFRAPLLCSVGLALGASCFEQAGYYLGISRTLVFFPFFVLGALWRERLGAVTSSWLKQACAVVVLSAGLYLAFCLRGEDPGWVYGSKSFAALGVGSLEGVLIRLGLYGASGLAVFSVIYLMPRSETPLGQRAGNMIWVYLWHGVLVRLGEGAGVFHALNALQPAVLYLLYSTTAIGMFVVLSSNAVKTFSEKVVVVPLGRLLLKSPH
jgi:fucose 4-O-acetylase-like acetyltransferase